MLFPSRILRDDDEDLYVFTIRYSATENIKSTEIKNALILTLNVMLKFQKEGN